MLKYLIPLYHPEVNQWTPQARLLRWLTLIWLLIGLVVLFSASYPVGEANFGDGLYYFKRQLIWAYLGLILFNFLTSTPIERFLKVSPYILLILSGFVIATTLVGKEVHGASRWIEIGPLLVQPSELIKPFLVLQSAIVFTAWKKITYGQRCFWLGIFGITIGAILTQPNLGNATLMGVSLWLIALIGMIRLKYLAITALGGLAFAAGSILSVDYQRQRVLSFLNPWRDPQESTYQLTQSLMAIGSGGTWGSGLGLSQQKLFYLPIQYTDFIFAVFAEEFGFVGCVSLLLLIMSWTTVALMVAHQAQKMVNRLIVVGAVSFLVGQAFINIGVATGALPTTGLPLPLISYGGNSVLASLLLAALVIRVARENTEGNVIPFPRRYTSKKNNFNQKRSLNRG